MIHTDTRVTRSKFTHLMTSLVTGLGKRQLNLSQPWKDRKIVLLVGPELKFENNESAQHRLQFPEIRKGAKFHFIGT